MSNIFELGLTPPPGVSFVQWGDGTIRIRYATKDVIPMRKLLIHLAKSLTEQAVMRLHEEKEAEIAKQKLPLTRLQKINEEMKLLKGEMYDIERDAIALAELESVVDEKIAGAEADTIPSPPDEPGEPEGPLPVH